MRHFNLDHSGYIKLARSIAEAAGFTIHFVKSAEMDPSGWKNIIAYTTEDTIYLNEPDVQWPAERWDEWWACFYHEIGHHDPRTKDMWDLLNADPNNTDTQKVNPKTLLSMVFNLYEDERQERITYKDYKHKTAIMDRAQPRLTSSIVNGMVKAKEENKYDTASPEYMVMLTNFVGQVRARNETWHPVYGTTDAVAKAALPEKFQEKLDLMDKLGFIDELKQGHLKAKDVLDFCRRVLEQVFDIPEEESNPSPPSKGEGKGEDGEKEERKGKNMSESISEEEADTLKDMIKSDHVADHDYGSSHETKTEIKDMVNSGHHVNYKNYNEKEWVPYIFHPVDAHILVDTVNNKVTVESTNRYLGTATNMCGQPNRKRNFKLEGSVGGFAQKIRRLLQIATKAKYSYAKRKGKLHGKSLFRIGMQDQSPEQASKVFKIKTTSDALNTAVTLLVDCSGSMSGHKFILACESAYKLAYVMNALRIPVEILGFTTTSGHTTPSAPRRELLHFKFKSFTDKYNSDVIKRGFGIASNVLSNNCDAEALIWAHSRLCARKELRKILIILSDGSPAGGNGDIYAATKKVAKQIEQHSSVELYAIGIEDRNVKNIYAKYDTIASARELESAVLSLVKRRILSKTGT